jgi:hypothetical protein
LRAGGRCGTIARGWVSAEGVMNNLDAEFDYERYRRLLAEATDETKRLALIDLLVNEKKPKTGSPCSRFATGWPNSADKIQGRSKGLIGQDRPTH